ncbi:hypothetical protein DFJ74DRAFT_654707 [Hyaloraphidium curvatum]|nr:hypothetical protein DFJ74DRAFT_654707 [Hyaloraphidium curvatum]
MDSDGDHSARPARLRRARRQSDALSSSQGGSQKRKRDGSPTPPSTRQRRPAKRVHASPEDEPWSPVLGAVMETEDLVLDREPGLEERAAELEALPPGEDAPLPCRGFFEFALFDLANDNFMRRIADLGTKRSHKSWNVVLEGWMYPLLTNSNGATDDVVDETVEDSDDESDSGGSATSASEPPQRIYVQSSSPFYYSLDFRARGAQVWVRTAFSWLLLVKPHERYEPYYRPLAKAARLTWRVLMVLTFAPDTELDEFIEHCLGDPFRIPGLEELPTGDRTTDDERYYPLALDADDLKAHAALIVEEVVQEITEGRACPDLDLSKSRPPLLVALERLAGKRVSRGIRRARGPGSGLDRDLKKERHRKTSAVTPRVKALHRGMFANTVSLPGGDSASASAPYSMPETPPFAGWGLDLDMKWVGGPLSTGKNRTYYAELHLSDGWPDKIVKIRAETDVVVAAESRVSWIGRVAYLFEERGRKYLHVRWFNPASTTALQELAPPRELVVLDPLSKQSCGDIEADTVSGVADVRFIPPPAPVDDPSDSSLLRASLLQSSVPDWADDPWPQDDPTEPANLGPMFYRYTSSEKELCFTVAPAPVDPSNATAAACSCCEAKEAHHASRLAYWIRDDRKRIVGVRVRGIDVYLHDTVYLQPELPDMPFDIMAITNFEEGGAEDESFAAVDNLGPVTVDREPVAPGSVVRGISLDRACDFEPSISWHNEMLVLEQGPDDVPEDHAAFDERELMVRVWGSFPRALTRIMGVCRVVHRDDVRNLDRYKDELVHNFWYDKKLLDVDLCRRATRADLPFSRRRMRLIEEQQRLEREFRAAHEPLAGLGAYSGAGGLDLGLEESGVFATKWAVEVNPSAAATFASVFPEAIVINEDARRTLEEVWGRDVLGNDDVTSDMPRIGEVEFTAAGPPCTPYSKLNQNKKVDDPNGAMIAVFLSYVDLYACSSKFKGFLLENVPALAEFSPGGTMAGTKMKGGIRSGVLKFIVRFCLDRGLCVRMGLLQAGRYDVAQGRNRLFVMAWRPGAHGIMPEFPHPTTVFDIPKKWDEDLQIGEGHNKMKFVANAEADGSCCAPHQRTTVLAAISDLPGFEYEDPGLVMDALPNRPFYRAYTTQETDQLGFAGSEDAAYRSAPKTNFQRLARKGAPELVKGHLAKGFASPELVEKLCKVPLMPGASSRMHPRELGVIVHPHSWKWKGMFGRVGMLGCFPTTTTTLNPGQKQGAIMHPAQRRTYTVRELARGHGFPDRVQFHARKDQWGRIRIDEMIKQIGNAVPVPLARSLGLAFRDAIFKAWLKERAG